MFGLDLDIQVVMESMFDLDPRMSLRSSEDDVFCCLSCSGCLAS